jgi:hypothetical protein
VLRANHRCKDGIGSDNGIISTRSISGAPVGEWELAFDDEQKKHMFE